jgi:hypothetical protein
MNKLYVGFTKEVRPSKTGLFIDDKVPKIPLAKVFDPKKHSFNPLAGIDYKKARQIADVLYTISPQGENTLTVRNGKRALLKALLKAKRLDQVRGDEEVQGMVDDILVSPVLRRVLCNPTNFSFGSDIILAKLNRAELGDFDALVLGLFLMAHFKGQVVVPDFGFYGREGHVSLIKENRLIAGVNSLGELPPKLRQNVLLIKTRRLAAPRPRTPKRSQDTRGLRAGRTALMRSWTRLWHRPGLGNGAQTVLATRRRINKGRNDVRDKGTLPDVLLLLRLMVWAA